MSFAQLAGKPLAGVLSELVDEGGGGGGGEDGTGAGRDDEEGWVFEIREEVGDQDVYD